MMVELIPVIEIRYSDPGIPFPEEVSYWLQPKAWDEFHALNYKKARLPDLPAPYLPGSAFFKVLDLPDAALEKIILDHTEEFRTTIYERGQASPLSGGCVLRINSQDIFFPQCCGELSDIRFWEKLVTEDKPGYFEGHPVPEVLILGGRVQFSFEVNEFDELFIPPPPYNKVEIEKHDLATAVTQAMKVLGEFAERVEQVNRKYNLGINRIDKLLVWGNQ
jgi:hypothetical protein